MFRFGLYQAGLRSSGEMFGFHFRLCLSPGARINVVSRLQKAHKLASIQKITDFPPQKLQSFLYPFSGLGSYLDRYWTQGYIPASFLMLYHPNYWLAYVRLSGLWTCRSSSSFTPVWRTWSKQKSCSALLRLTGLIITPLQRGWTTFLLSNSQRWARRLWHFSHSALRRAQALDSCSSL